MNNGELEGEMKMSEILDRETKDKIVEQVLWDDGGMELTTEEWRERYWNVRDRTKELEAENAELKLALQEAVARAEQMEYERDSETKWAKTYCDAFVKVRDAAKEYFTAVSQMRTLGGGSSYQNYKKAYKAVEEALKDTENV